MVDDAVDWLRNNSSSAEDLDNPTVYALAELAGIPLLHQVLEGNNLEWLRKNTPNLQDRLDELTVRSLELGSPSRNNVCSREEASCG